MEIEELKLEEVYSFRSKYQGLSDIMESKGKQHWNYDKVRYIGIDKKGKYMLRDIRNEEPENNYYKDCSYRLNEEDINKDLFKL